MTGTNYQKFLNIVTPELDEIFIATRDIRIAHAVEKSRGKSLDYIGILLDFKRSVNESDDSYRERLKNIIYINTIAGTKESIRKLLANYLRIPETHVVVQEQEPNYILVMLPPDCQIYDKDIQDMVRKAVAAGIYVGFYYAISLWDVSEWDSENAIWY